MPLKNPAQFFESNIPEKEEEVLSQDKSNETFNRYKGNLDKVEQLKIKIDSIYEELNEGILNGKIDSISEQLENKISKEDLENAMFSHLMVVDENFKSIKEQVNGVNQRDLQEFKKIYNTYKNLSNILESKSIKNDEKIEEYSKILEDINFRLNDYKTSSLLNVETYIRTHRNDLVELKENVFSDIKNILDGDIRSNIKRVENKIDIIKEKYESIDTNVIVGEVIKEGLLNIPSNEKNSDELTPLDKNFVTFDQLQKHYTLFINRIQQQLSTLGGGGETQLKYLDDLVGIATNASAYDGKYLKYNHSIGKFEFTNVDISHDTWAEGEDGPYTMGSVGIGTSLQSSGIYPGNKLIVQGNTRITGEVKIGEGTIVLSPISGSIKSGDTEVVSGGGGANFAGIVTAAGFVGPIVSSGNGVVGTSLSISGISTLGITTITDDLYVAGVVTATSFVGDGSQLTGIDATALKDDGGNIKIQANSSGAVVTGVVTATSFVGDGSELTGIISGLWESNATGINTSTNVSIGTTTASSALTVDGDGRFTGVVSATTFRGVSGGGDAVFIGDGSGLTGITASGSGIVVRDDDNLIGIAGTINFGTNLDVSTISAGVVTVTSVTEVSGDTTPQLGGYLDLNSKGIYGSGIVTATSFVKDSGTSSQFLKADGSVDSSTYLTSYSETSTLDNVLGRGNISSVGLSVGVVTATSFDGSLATSNLTGSITNAQLGGSIANDKLVHSQVNYGGVQLSLGTTDTTPAFDLSDATNYPYTSLTGITTEIVGDTTPQLGGDLDGNSKDIYGVGVITATTFSGALTGSVTGNVTGTATTATNLADAANITTGTIDVARLGSGASGTKFLRGDNTWQTVSSGGGGASGLWESNATGINTSTNIGIGTTTASSALTVVGDATISGVATFSDDVRVDEYLYFGGTANPTYIYGINGGSGTGKILFNAGNNYRLELQSGAFYPISDEMDLGKSDERWENFYVKNVDISGSTTFAGITTFAGLTTVTSDDALHAKQLSISGVATATTFSGNLTGTASTSTSAATAYSLTGNIGDFSTRNITSTGIVTATSFKGPAGGAAATFIGDGSGLTGITASGSGIVIKDSGSLVGTAGTIDFGDNLSVSAISGSSVTITASGSKWESNATGINTSTNVSIGTTTASSALTVSGDGNFTGVITATTFSGSGASLTSIPNSALNNSLISYGGVEVSLGGAIAQPGFNLTNATDYPYTSLTGVTTDIIGDTTPQLGGYLDLNSKGIYGTGIVTATSFVKSSGTSSQFLKADGSVDSSTYLTSYTETSTLDNVLGRGNISGIGLSVGVVTATSFVGDVTGIATGATRVYIDEAEDDNVYYNIVFSDVAYPDGGGDNYRTLQVDNASLTFNPGTNTLVTQKIVGSALASIEFPNGATSSGVITATTFSGALTGDVTGTATTATNLADAANITTGTIAAARLGSGVDAAKFLRGDNTWQTVSSGGGGIGSVEDDTAPKLGGDLDINSKNITGTGNIDIAGNLDVSGISTLGTITSGTWQGTDIADDYIASAATWDGKQDALIFGIANTNAVKIDVQGIADDDYARFTPSGLEGRNYTEVKTDLSLNNVENTALSTWVGTTNITTLGTIATGIWSGTTIADAYVASSATWNAKQNALTFGIANTNAVKIDGQGVADDEYARFTANGLEGRTSAELKSDLSLSKSDVGLGNVENTALSTWAGTSNITTLGTIATGTWEGTAIAYNALSGVTTHIIGDTSPQLGGNLDINSKDITGTGNIDITGSLDVSGITTLGKAANGAVELYYDNSLKFITVGTGVSISNGVGNTATIFGPSNIIIDPHPIGVGTTSGNVRIKGDLYVDGTQFIVNSETITLGDFVVGIGTTVTTDALTDGAGIGIGSIGYEKTFLYEYNSGTNPSLKSSENLNVASGKAYQIAETSVLNATTLGSGVVNSSLTGIGTITSGTWNGTAIADAYVASAATWNAKQNALTFGIANTNAVKIDDADAADDDYAKFTATGIEGRSAAELKSDLSLAKSDVGLGNVENTALSTWAGTTNITTLGTVASGIWSGTAIADGYLASTFLKNIVDDTSPQLGENLDINGKYITGTGGISITGVVTSTDFNTTSDFNLKTNIQSISNPLEKVMQIRGVDFEWNDTNKISMGVIAQEIEKVFPQLVTDSDPKTVNYNGLIGLLIECVKEQQKEIDELKNWVKGIVYDNE